MKEGVKLKAAVDKHRLKSGAFKNFEVIGWREWVRLPKLGISFVKVKVDTGARTSALHAFDIEYFRKRGKEYVRFKVHPIQRSRKTIVSCEAQVIEHRLVKSSSGHSSLRPVISTDAILGELSWKIELTLTNRDEMGFRMLLGRRALQEHLLVHPSKSFLFGNPSGLTP